MQISLPLLPTSVSIARLASFLLLGQSLYIHFYEVRLLLFGQSPPRNFDTTFAKQSFSLVIWDAISISARRVDSTFEVHLVSARRIAVQMRMHHWVIVYLHGLPIDGVLQVPCIYLKVLFR